MELSNKHCYLALSSAATGTGQQYTISCYPKLQSAIAKWEYSTRVSPIWPIANSTSKEITSKGYLLILGPCNPFDFDFSTSLISSKKISAYLSLGLMNLLVHARTKADLKTAIAWAKKSNIPYEEWHISANGKVDQITPSATVPTNARRKWGAKLSKLLTAKKAESIHLAISEFCPLVAAAITRAEIYNLSLSSNLIHLVDYVESAVQEAGEPQHSQNMNEYVIAAMVTKVNAGLSRLSSQCLSGTQPITGTESHFWVHSLFGIGTANIGLNNLVGFISRTLGEALIPNRLLDLANRTSNIPNLNALVSKDPFWQREHLPPNTYPVEQLDPDICFFSGRDGFQAHLTNISVPLTTIFSAGTERWSLLTVTHEISHKIIKAVLSILIPLDNSLDTFTIDKARARKLMSSPPANWLDDIRIWFWTSIGSMTADHHLSGKATDVDVFDAIDEWYGEVEEILVHVFDFTYFYNSDTKKYLREIWLTWSVIPNISSRVEEYALRSICAVLSTAFHRDGQAVTMSKAIEFSIDAVLDVLNKLLVEQSDLTYVNQAIATIAKKRAAIHKSIAARSSLVRFVKCFLYTTDLQNKLQKETRIFSSESSNPAGYQKSYLTLDDQKFDNPIRFIESFSTRKAIVEAESAWLFFNLAFNVRDAEGGGT